VPTPTERNSEQIQVLERKLVAAQEREATLLRDVELLQGLADKQRDDLAALRQEVALLRQELAAHLERVKIWDGRIWGVIVLLIGAALSLASGLITTLVVTLTRK
jgi:hypothetical protein